MADQLLLPLLPGTLPPNQCYNSEQERLNGFAQNLQAVLAGCTFFSDGTEQPDPQFNNFLWFNRNDGRWYFYSGAWLSPVNYDSNERRLFVGSLTDLQTYDGGDTNTPSDRSGPMWVEDTDFQGRSPMGPGAIPTSNPAKTLSVEEAFGEGAHALTADENGAHSHTTQNVGDTFATLLDGTGASQDNTALRTVAPDATDTNGWLGSWPNTGTSGTGAAHNTVHPVVGCYIIKWSGRIYRRAS